MSAISSPFYSLVFFITFLVPAWGQVQGEPVVDGDLLPLLYPPVSGEGADEPKPRMVHPGPAAVWLE